MLNLESQGNVNTALIMAEEARNSGWQEIY